MKSPSALQGARDAFSYVQSLLGTPVTVAAALRATQERLSGREDGFLASLERTVFAHPGSPYRPLLQAAEYDLPTLRARVGREGLERTLERLALDGVCITVEEFKGITATRRGDQTFHFEERDFLNPLVPSGLSAPSGGTRGRSRQSPISLSNHRMGAEHLALALDAYGLREASMAVWLAQTHGASVWAVLALAAMGQPPARWFTHVSAGTASRRARAYPYLLWMAARRQGVRLPLPAYVPLGHEERVLRWLAPRRDAHRGVFTTPSLALRVALAAQRSGADLAGVTFLTVGEPLTPAKLGHIRTVGAAAFSTFGFSEFGRATYGCPAAEGDETHICADGVAVIQRDRPVDRLGTSVPALLFTSLWTDARRILLNVETGDYASPVAGGCGCLLERAGWKVRLRDIRSFEKLNAEGRLFYGSLLIDLVDTILPGRFGGDLTAYQLVEQEDAQGFTRLSVFVDPRLGAIDEAAVARCVADVLRAQDTRNADVWTDAGTVRVVRARPIVTAAGKLMPLHHMS